MNSSAEVGGRWVDTQTISQSQAGAEGAAVGRLGTVTGDHDHGHPYPHAWYDRASGVVVIPQSAIETSITTSITEGEGQPGWPEGCPNPAQVQNQLGTQQVSLIEIYVDQPDGLGSKIRAAQDATASTVDLLSAITGRLARVAQATTATVEAAAATDEDDARLAKRLGVRG